MKKRKIPCSCLEFYVNKHVEKVIGKPRMFINYTNLNEALVPIRHPIPNKEALLRKFHDYNIFKKFDLKSGFW
jgi:hypothetical protein